MIQKITLLYYECHQDVTACLLKLCTRLLVIDPYPHDVMCCAV